MPRAPFSRERCRTPRTRRREIVVPIPRRFKAARVGAPDGRGGAKITLEMADEFTREERAALAPYFTNLDGPVFALVNLSEVVKGALFARYSRSPKSLRRLFLDEFRAASGSAADAARVVARQVGDAGTKRAEQLYERVFFEYGDDSVAQLGGVHLACEGASNILTKVLEWGRLMAYLEQSTRYIPYTDRPGGRWRYHVPVELDGHPLRPRYVEILDRAFETYGRWIEPLRAHWAARLPRPSGTSDTAWNSTIRAKALDSLGGLEPEPRPEVTLTDFDPDGEIKVVAAALYASSRLPDDQLLAIARKLGLEERHQVLDAYVGKRTNRRHKPGRAFERTAYRFDVLGDYGAFRDLQRHRLLTLEWQRLTPQHGSVMPEAIVEARVEDRWHRSLDASAALHDAIAAAGLVAV